MADYSGAYEKPDPAWAAINEYKKQIRPLLFEFIDNKLDDAEEKFKAFKAIEEILKRG